MPDDPTGARAAEGHSTGNFVVVLGGSGETLPVILRREVPDDHAEIFAVHTAAFSRPDGSDVPEAKLVNELRDDGDAIAALSLVATIEDDVVGHVVGSRADIGGCPSLGLGPLGVLPFHQRRGVGNALMHGVSPGATARCVGRVAARNLPLRTGLRSPVAARSGHQGRGRPYPERSSS